MCVLHVFLIPGVSLFILWFLFAFPVYFLLFVLSLVVSTSANDCLERLVSEMTYYVSSAWDVKLYSLTHSLD